MEASHTNSNRLLEIWLVVARLAREMYDDSDVTGDLKATVLMLASPLFSAFMQAAIEGKQEVSSLYQLWCYAYATYTLFDKGIDIKWQLGCKLVEEVDVSYDEKEAVKEFVKLGLQYVASWDSSKKVYKDDPHWHPLK